MTPCEKSTVLFPYFAEWFVDGFLRSERPHPDPETGELVRDPRAQRVQPRDRPDPDLRAQRRRDPAVAGRRGRPAAVAGHRRRGVPALPLRGRAARSSTRSPSSATSRSPATSGASSSPFGSDTGNLQLGFVMMGVLFLREHNRIARLLEQEYPDWDDERLFQTTRNILTVILIKIVVEEYINHISPFHLKLLADPTGFRNPRWYRQNWMAIEFNLLYRWHSLVPSSFRIGGRDVAVDDTLFNTDIRRRARARRLLRGRVEPAGRACRPVQLTARRCGRPRSRACEQSRAVELRPYNEYRRARALPTRERGSRTSRATAGCSRDCATSTGASTTSSSIPACSPRTSGATPCCRR